MKIKTKTNVNLRQQLQIFKMDSSEAKRRYLEKISICGQDPYDVRTKTEEVPLNVSFTDIYNFMVLDPNPFTGEAKDSAKGMQANLWFQQGWVKHVGGKQLGEHFIVHGRVLHSFNLRKQPLKPWIIVRTDGKILAAHCDCAIGLLETCSHVGATLFALDDIRRKVSEQKISVTDLPAYWTKPPVTASENLYKKARDISFGRRIKRHWDPVPPPCADRYSQFFSAIQDHNINVAGMMTFCGVGEFQCNSCEEHTTLQNDFYDYDLNNLFDKSYREKSKEEQLALVEMIFYSMAKEEAKLEEIAKMTVLQSASKQWSVFRLGRLTASNLKDICRTNVSKPSMSLIRKICCPNRNLQTESMRYGKDHEHVAFDMLYNSEKPYHVNLRKEECGLLISSEKPFLGASPDGFLLCDCHGKISIEIKCPVSGRDSCDFTDALLKMTDPFLKKSEINEIQMNTNHKYYYQTLMQIYLSNAAFGYFYVWSPEKQYLFEVSRNDELWNQCISKSELFFKEVILPELLFNAFTNPL